MLKGCSLSIRGGEKIGIVGRTGAGKSSILVALYRLAELRSGAILIDVPPQATRTFHMRQLGPLGTRTRAFHMASLHGPAQVSSTHFDVTSPPSAAVSNA